VGRDGEGYITDLGQAASIISENQNLFWGVPWEDGNRVGAPISIRAALGGTTDTTRRPLNRRFDPKHITACSTASRMMSSKITYVPSLIISDEVGFVHAMLSRIQALLLPVKTLVLSGH
jgi:hypothetical protein